MAAADREERRQALFVELLAAQPRVFRYCRSYLRSEQDALDACQETYLEVLLQVDRLVDHANPMGWLFVTAKNKCRNAARRRRPAERLAEHHEGAGPDVADGLVDREDAQRLLQRLPARDRSIVELRCRGYSSREVGEQLGISENAVNLRLHRVRRLLRDSGAGPGRSASGE
jgi:RNA polymerase sigma factor (sigma-70 family)